MYRFNNYENFGKLRSCNSKSNEFENYWNVTVIFLIPRAPVTVSKTESQGSRIAIADRKGSRDHGALSLQTNAPGRGVENRKFLKVVRIGADFWEGDAAKRFSVTIRVFKEKGEAFSE